MPMLPMEPVAEPGVPEVSAVHLAQPMVSACAGIVAMTAQVAMMSAVAGLKSRHVRRISEFSFELSGSPLGRVRVLCAGWGDVNPIYRERGGYAAHAEVRPRVVAGRCICHIVRRLFLCGSITGATEDVWPALSSGSRRLLVLLYEFCAYQKGEHEDDCVGRCGGQIRVHVHRVALACCPWGWGVRFLGCFKGLSNLVLEILR